MRLIGIVGIAALFLVLGAPLQAGEPQLTAAEGATAHALATAAETLERWIPQLEGCPLEGGRMQTLAEVQHLMPKDQRNSMVLQDGWMRPLQAWCNADHWAVVSYGADGVPAFDYGRLPELGDTGDDFVVFDGDFGSAPNHVLVLVQLGRQRRSMADLRSIGIVFEAYHLDNDTFPGEPITTMEPVLRILSDAQPVYIRTLPLTDGWGNAFLFWTNGVTYRIASAGRDGIFETDYTTQPGVGPFDPREFDRDIVFANGEYEQFPAMHDEE